MNGLYEKKGSLNPLKLFICTKLSIFRIHHVPTKIELVFNIPIKIYDRITFEKWAKTLGWYK